MKRKIISTFIGLTIASTSFNLQADSKPEGMKSELDRYPGSLLYSKPVEVSPGVYTAIGQTFNYTYENGGHNNNLSFIVGDDAVLVVNSSSSAQLAEDLHDEIKKITDKPVKYVVVENGQRHATFGTNYWQSQGSKVIGHKDALLEMDHFGPSSIEELRETLKDQLDGTEVPKLDETFEDSKVFDLGGIKVEARYLGPAHSVGDISLFVNDVIIAGDIAFHQRLLPVFPGTDTGAWIDTWNNVFTPLAQDKIIIPGHGSPTTFDVVDKYTRGYLEFMREEVGKLLDEGGTLADSYNIDQSAYSHLETYDILAAKNASRIFELMEFE